MVGAGGGGGGGQNELEGIVGVNLGVWSTGVANYSPAPPPPESINPGTSDTSIYLYVYV